MDDYPMTVEVEFRVMDNNGEFDEVKLSQDGNVVVVEQNDKKLRISSDQFSDLRLCMDLLCKQMNRSTLACFLDTEDD